jgi:transcriptional regulator with PAS, ATPase and Fis domain
LLRASGVNVANKAMRNEVRQAERMIAEFFAKSNVGLAVFDSRMRFRVLNPCLASLNGTSIESHLGKHVREILPDCVGIPVEQAIRKVFDTASPVLDCEVTGALSTRPDGGHWLDTLFPISDSDGRIKQVAAIVIELPQDSRFQQAAPEGQPNRPLLRSWKEIAQYMGASIKTVQRWEQILRFPVRRMNPNKGSVVFAFQNEVDEWLRGRSIHPHVGRH